MAGRAVLLDTPIEGELPLILELLGISGDGPSARSGRDDERLFATLSRLLLGRREAAPSVIVVEELRWIDPPSEAILKALVEALPSTPTLLIASFRPEYRAGWLRPFNYTSLRLQPLDERSLAALLRDQLGTDPSLAPLAERIPDRVGGNPFFVEELIRDLVESGGLEGERGALRAAGPIHESALPASVQAVLAARIDRLAEPDKNVLQAAAVIGHRFTEPLLKRVTGLDDQELWSTLRSLVRADLFVPSTTAAAGYAFRHDLTQEVAYRSELRERRARLHGAVARALEEQSPDRRDELAGLISHHLEQAGERSLTAHRELRRQLPITPRTPLTRERAARGTVSARHLGRSSARAPRLTRRPGQFGPWRHLRRGLTARPDARRCALGRVPASSRLILGPRAEPG